MSVLRDKEFSLFDVALLGAALIVGVGLISPKVRHWIIGKRVDAGSIATVVIPDIKNGTSRKYEISKIIEQKDSYCLFETTDGRVIEVLESEIQEK